MSLYFDVACTDRDVSPQERRERTVRAIGEILPLVMAKYGAVAPPGRLSARKDPRLANRFPQR
jgi:hypothetical protein